MEADTDAKWCPKGTWRPGAVNFQCREDIHATSRRTRWRVEIDVPSWKIDEILVDRPMASAQQYPRSDRYDNVRWSKPRSVSLH